MTKLFFDTEFTGLHQKTTLISMGIVSECGKTFYAEFTDFDKSQIDDWLKENVLRNLKLRGFIEYIVPFDNQKDYMIRGTTQKIKRELDAWLKQFDQIEVWSDCLHYDWVLFCELFGGTMNIPKNIYYIPFDICTTFKEKGIDPDINREEFAGLTLNTEKHNALWDAKVIKECWTKLQKL